MEKVVAFSLGLELEIPNSAHSTVRLNTSIRKSRIQANPPPARSLERVAPVSTHQMFAAILLLLLSGLATPLFAQFSPDLLSGRLKARGIVTTFYSEDDQSRLLTISVKRIYTDHERRGFFKLGMLPVAVLEDATVEIPDPKQIREALSQFGQWLGPAASKRVEIRGFTLVLKGDHGLRLECGRAKFGPMGILKLSDGVRLSPGTTNNVTSASGSLQIAGERSGDLLLLSTPPVRIELFSNNQLNPGASHENKANGINRTSSILVE